MLTMAFRMSMAEDEAIRSDFSSYLKKLKEQYLPDHPTAYLAGSYLDNYEMAKGNQQDLSTD